MKKAVAIFVCILTVLAGTVSVTGTNDLMPFETKAKSALLMEAKTGKVLYAKGADTPYPPASVTKLMTVLLIAEQIDSGKMNLSDKITVSEYASSMGGSQVYLEPGEEITVKDLLKSVVISSANDGAVAFAEAISGSEEEFVKRMNERARELGMKNSRFENATGLDGNTENHLMSAYDIALVSQKLLNSHPYVTEYSSTWMDSIRNGEFGLTNTNRLIRFYKGANGLKTGYTAKAGYCVSATAEREGMTLIAVIMGCSTRDERNAQAKKLLDHGFAKYALYEQKEKQGPVIELQNGQKAKMKSEIEPFLAVVEKDELQIVKEKLTYVKKTTAPIEKGDKVGTVTYMVNGKKIGSSDVRAAEDVEAIGYFDIILRMIKAWFLVKNE